jgi:hypothetical protein
MTIRRDMASSSTIPASRLSAHNRDQASVRHHQYRTLSVRRSHPSAAKRPPPSLGVQPQRVGLPPLTCITLLHISMSTVKFAFAVQASTRSAVIAPARSPVPRRVHLPRYHRCVHVVIADSSMHRSSASDMRARASDVSNQTSKARCCVCFC